MLSSNVKAEASFIMISVFDIFTTCRPKETLSVNLFGFVVLFLCIHLFIFMVSILINTVNPLYNDIPYNSKIRYNVNSLCTKIRDRVFFH